MVPWDEFLAVGVAREEKPASVEVEDIEEGPPKKKAKTGSAKKAKTGSAKKSKTGSAMH